MSSFAIVTDSTANLPKAFIEKQGIYVLPLTWISGEKEAEVWKEKEKRMLCFMRNCGRKNISRLP